MNGQVITCCGLTLLLFARAYGGTFTTHDTLIPVPARADGMTNGDTSATTSNTIRLDATVYLPDGATSPAPVIVVLHGFGSSKNYSKTVALAEDFAAAGDVVLTPTARGFGDSDGEVSLAGPNEINDLKTMILTMQTGTIGDTPLVNIPVTSASKFGVTGISYGAGQTWELMRTKVAGLATVAPILGWTDLYQALAPNDVVKLSYTLGLFASGYDVQNPNYSDQMFDWMGDFLDGLPEQTRMGDAQSNVDWRSVIFNPGELAVPTFVIQGWRDFLFPAEQAITLFAATNNIPFFKMYLGGLGHPPGSADMNGPEALYVRAQALRWFDQWLKGADTGILSEPRVTLAPERTEDWTTNGLVQSDTFPLPGTTTRTLYINKTTLTATSAVTLKPRQVPPTRRGSPFLSDILNFFGFDDIGLIEDVLSVNDILNSGAADIIDPGVFTGKDADARRAPFNTDPLPADLTVVGNPDVQLYVSAKKGNAYYFVQIEDKPPIGDAKLVTRGAFKDHAADPKTPHLIEFSLFAINHRFVAGNQIKLVISSRDYPFYIPNLKQSSVRIYRDAAHPSALLLPVAP